MPVLTKITCECGSTDGWRIDEDTAECWECGQTARRVLKMPAMLGRFFMRGDGDNGGVYHPQAGRRFHSMKEMEQWAEANDLEMVSPSDSKWRGIRDRNREEADKDAKRDGWSSAEERATAIRENKRDIVAANRQRQIDKYHDEHGNEGKQSLEEAFSTPLPD